MLSRELISVLVVSIAIVAAGLLCLQWPCFVYHQPSLVRLKASPVQIVDLVAIINDYSFKPLKLDLFSVRKFPKTNHMLGQLYTSYAT